MSLPNLLVTIFCVCLVPCGTALAIDEAPANSELVVDQPFDDDQLDDNWHINAGRWETADGVLRVRELEADRHAAAARYQVETRNAVYQLRFRIVGQGKAFHLGFDPAPGELDKRGHLFSVVITPTSWKVVKHADKSRPKEDPTETLASMKRAFERDQWYQLRVTTWSNYVTATIDSRESLKASHRSFGVKKPTLVFRCLGDGIEIDDIKVWRQVK